MITDRIYNLQSFQRQFEALLSLSVSEGIPNLNRSVPQEELLEKIDWNNVLSIASALCYSDKAEHLDAALRIAQTCLSSDTSDAQKSAAAFILEILTNKPALRLAIQRGFINAENFDNVPVVFKLQSCKVGIENSIYLNNRVISLNRFQKTVYETYKAKETISISAPTSAGKSFILYQILVEELIAGRKNIVFIVPTRALISQVEQDIRNLIKEHQLQDVSISTVPQTEQGMGTQVFVFTQERLHWYLTGNPNIKIDVLFVDEAQKIEDGNRGILLQQKIEEVAQLNPHIKIFFSSPFTSNPELLYEHLENVGEKDKVDTQFVSVNQNLIYVQQVPKKVDKYKASLVTIDKPIELGTVSLSDRPGTSEIKKLALISVAMSSNRGGNIIYANGSAQAENLAQILYSLLGNISVSGRVEELIKLVKKTIHRDYALAKVLDKGIAFHYGNMPLLIRQEIENLFKEGDVKYLICTSTLLEGVNLPSKSIFIRKPTRGKGNPLNQNDFWNLAGRAGRWGKEFSGNIVCIEPHKWEIQPNPKKEKQTIQRALDNVSNQSRELVEYINNGSPRNIAEERQDLEFAFGYYYIRFLNKQLDLNNPVQSELNVIFQELSQRITLPDYIIKRNPGISPIAQQSLLDYFGTMAAEIESLIPVYPEDENAYYEYTDLVDRIGKTIANYPHQLNKSRAILLIYWMQGRPLSFLISESFKSYQKSEQYRKKKTLPVVIREVMDNVEEFVRFRFAKDSSCYIDILRYFLEVNARLDLLPNIPELNLWLEFGVSQKTHLSLLALGLARNTVIELSAYMPYTQMSKDECLEWIRTNNFESLELSPIIKDDIRKSV